MNLLTIPLRNIRRRPLKTGLLLLVFSLGVMSIVTLSQVSRVVGHNLEQQLNSFGANIMVSPHREKLSVSYGGFHLGEMLLEPEYLQEAATKVAIESIGLRERISTVAPKLVTMVRLKEQAVALVGVRWDQELRLKSYWGTTSGRFPRERDELLVGARAATALGLSQGDRLAVLGRELVIGGILSETGSDDDSVLLMDLGLLQELMERPGAASFVEVAALCSGCPIEDIVAQLRESLPAAEVTALQQVVNQRMASVRFVQRLALSISVIILVTASAMIGLSMLSAVNERRCDIGILRSLGYARSRIFLIFCLEAALLGAMAGCGGYLTGLLAADRALGLLSLAEGLTPQFDPGQLVLSSLAFTAIAVIAALYPAWQGARIEPAAALTQF
ncbi:ABC transporter permease [Desulfogranum mediterraneum]|uniref:ABC transporter permease n=1 Tax=Desulfogranum mediterraneum TaxID=160661 RepID=UPI000402B13D|nr:FtsX-like permease family protein [Desulfogranum mediterraneum]